MIQTRPRATGPEVATLATRLDEAQRLIDQQRAEIDALRSQLREIPDDLTGLHSRRWLRGFWTALGDRPATRVSAVMFIDLDQFKQVNDHYGHKNGDRILAHAGAVILASGAFGVRLGGDEFLALTSAGADVPLLAEQLSKEISEPVECRDPENRVVPLAVTASIGICRVRDGLRLSELLDRADMAMYRVKHGHGERYLIAE